MLGSGRKCLALVIRNDEPLVEAAVLKFTTENRQLGNEASFVPVVRWYASVGAVKSQDERLTGALDSPTDDAGLVCT